MDHWSVTHGASGSVNYRPQDQAAVFELPIPFLLLWNGLIVSAQAALLGLCEASEFRMPVLQGAPRHPLRMEKLRPEEERPGQCLNFPETPPFPLCILSLEILSHGWNGPRHRELSFPLPGAPELPDLILQGMWGMGRTSAQSSGDMLLEAPLSVSLSEPAQGTRGQEEASLECSARRVGLCVAQHSPAPRCPHPKPA